MNFSGQMCTGAGTPRAEFITPELFQRRVDSRIGKDEPGYCYGIDTKRSYINSEVPLWREPPQNLAEIRRLQESQQ